MQYRLIIDVEYDTDPHAGGAEKAARTLKRRLEDALTTRLFRTDQMGRIEGITVQVRRLPTAYEQVIDLAISETDLPRHVQRALKHGFDVTQVRELEELAEARLRDAVSGPRSVRHFGVKSFQVLCTWAEEHGIRWLDT